MALPVATATNSGHQDANQNYSVIGVQGTLGTADTNGTAPTIPFSANPSTGAQYVEILAGGGGGTSGTVVAVDHGTITLSNPTGTTVQFNNGTIDLVKAGSITPSDGTYSQNIMAQTSVSNAANRQAAALTAGAFAERSGSASSVADILSSVDVSNYKSLGLQIGGTFVGTVVFEGSNDNTNWMGVRLQDMTTANNTGTLVTGSEFRMGLVYFRYFRTRMATYTSGTATAILELYTYPLTMSYSSVNQNNGPWSVSQSTGTVNTGTINTGTINSGTINVGTINAGTINTGTITAGSIVVTGGTILAGTLTALQNGTITAGSIVVTAGTIAGGSIVMTNGTVSHGTIDAGTVQLNPKPTIVSNTYGTTTNGTIGTLVAAPSAGSAIFVTSLDVNQQSGTAETVVSWGLAAAGNQVLSRGNYVAGGGISKNMISPISGSATGTALTFNMLTGSGTVSYNVAYFVAVP